MAYSDAIVVVMQIQRKLQLQIEKQGKCLQMMFEKQREMEDSKLSTSPSPSNEVYDKPEISSIIATTMVEECSEDASTKQKADETGVIDEEMVMGGDQLRTPATKRVKTG